MHTGVSLQATPDQNVLRSCPSHAARAARRQPGARHVHGLVWFDRQSAVPESEGDERASASLADGAADLRRSGTGPAGAGGGDAVPVRRSLAALPAGRLVQRDALAAVDPGAAVRIPPW